MIDNTFVLYEHDDLGEIVEINYCRVWLIVDKRDFDWSVTIPPMKETIYYNETHG